MNKQPSKRIEDLARLLRESDACFRWRGQVDLRIDSDRRLVVSMRYPVEVRRCTVGNRTVTVTSNGIMSNLEQHIHKLLFRVI